MIYDVTTNNIHFCRILNIYLLHLKNICLFLIMFYSLEIQYNHNGVVCMKTSLKNNFICFVQTHIFQ